MFVVLSPRYPDSVFIFGPLVNEILQPNGTCFIISDRYLLTAQHNMTKNMNGDWNTVGYGIALVVDVQEPPIEFHIVTIKYYNIEYNYAILELVGQPFSGDRVSIPITIDSDGDSSNDIHHNTDFKIFHIPILDYQCQVINSISAYTAWGKIVNIDTRDTHDDKHRRCIYGNISLYRGSSGTPFVLRNGSVFAMYVENKFCIPTDITIKMNKGVDASNVADSGDEDDNDSDISDISITYSDAPVLNKSRCCGLYFKNCPPLMEQLYELGILKQ